MFQNKVSEEQESIFQGSDRSVTMKDLNEMKYLERVIKESLRLYPSVPFIGREITQDVQLGKLKIADCQRTRLIFFKWFNCMEQRHFAEANMSSASREIPHFLWNPRITTFTRARSLSQS